MLHAAMSAHRLETTRRRRHGWLVHLAAVLAAVSLTAFHLVLLWQRVVDQSLFKPVPAIRWLVTFVFLYGLYRLHRRGVSLVRGRSALVFWLLVLLLHASFWGPLAESESIRDGWTGTALLLALPACSIVLVVGLALVRRLLTSAWAIHRDARPSPLDRVWSNQLHALQAGVLPTLACRPPPSS